MAANGQTVAVVAATPILAGQHLETLPPADDHEIEVASGKGREARLDLLLAEELAVDRDFAAWFLREAGVWPRPGLPERQHRNAVVRINHVEKDLPASASGETDIDLTLEWEDGHSLAVLIEDKVWSPFGWLQPERYVKRAALRGGVAVVVAPDSYLESHKKQVRIFGGWVPIEDIIRRLRSHSDHGPSDPSATRRREWRADLMAEVIVRRVPPVVIDDEPTVEFTRFCMEWFEEHAKFVIPSPLSLHSAGQGWLGFENPVGLIYKAYGWARKPRAGVDLYLADQGFDGSATRVDELLREIGLPEGFKRTVDTAKPPNLVLRYDCARAIPSEGRPVKGSTRDAEVVDALEACGRVAAWVEVNHRRNARTG